MKSPVPATMIESLFRALSSGEQGEDNRCSNAQRNRERRQLTKIRTCQQIGGHHAQVPTEGESGDHRYGHDHP